MRLIDADALLEAIHKIYGDNHAPQGIINLITTTPTIQREGWVSVPIELIDRFPEINMDNYGDEEVRNLNNWGIELVIFSRTKGVNKDDNE